jgi:hypothetical protein
MYKRVQFVINKCELKVDLLPLELHNFDVILGMDWLSMNKTQIDFFAKIVTLYRPNGRKIMFRGEKCHHKLYYLGYDYEKDGEERV